MQVSCGQETTLRVFPDHLVTTIHRFSASFSDGALSQLLPLLDDVIRGAAPDRQLYVEAECPFEGSVDVRNRVGGVEWTCPVCGAEHDEER